MVMFLIYSITNLAKPFSKKSIAFFGNIFAKRENIYIERDIDNLSFFKNSKYQSINLSTPS